MCPCKKEYLPPPDTLWFFLLLGFALAVALLFLLCQLLKYRVNRSLPNGLVFLPEAESKKSINPEFSDLIAHKEKASSAVPVVLPVPGSQTKDTRGVNAEQLSLGLGLAAATGAALGNTGVARKAALSSIGQQSRVHNVQLKSGFAAKARSGKVLRALDVKALSISLTESTTQTESKSTPKKEPSLISAGSESDEAPNEDEEEISPGMQNTSPLKRRALNQPEIESKLQNEALQTSATTASVASNVAMNQTKIQLRSLPVEANQNSATTATKTVKAVGNENSGDIMQSCVGQSETIQNSQTQRIITTETTQGRYVNNASLSRLRKREYELATLLQHLRNVEVKVGHLSTELEKKDLFNTGYRHGSQNMRLSPVYTISSNRSNFHNNSTNKIQHSLNDLHGSSNRNSPLITVTSTAMTNQQGYSNAQYVQTMETGQRILTPVRNEVSTNATETNRISVNPLSNLISAYSTTATLPASPGITRRVLFRNSNNETVTNGNGMISPSQKYTSCENCGLTADARESTFLQSNRYQDGSIATTRFTASRNSLEDFEVDSELKLAEALRQLRTENELRLAQTRDEQEAAYAKRESELYKQILTLANSFQEQNNEFNSLQLKLFSLEKNLAELHGKKLSAESSLRETKSSWQEGQGQFKNELFRLQDLIRVMEAEKQELLSKYHHLQEVKTTLDSEIATYQSLLEEEEQRIDQISKRSGTPTVLSSSVENRYSRLNPTTQQTYSSSSRLQGYESEI